jgi:hypothetical protein
MKAQNIADACYFISKLGKSRAGQAYLHMVLSEWTKNWIELVKTLLVAIKGILAKK